MNSILKIFLFLTAGLLFIFAGLSPLKAQKGQSRYWVQFTDKQGTPCSIERRTRQHVPVVESDLPVTPDYINTIRSLGVKVISTSKWLNSIVILVHDTMDLDLITGLPFVKQIGYAAPAKRTTNPAQPKQDKWHQLDSLNGNFEMGIFPLSRAIKRNSGTYDYGYAYNQIRMINGDFLHDKGFSGEGMIIAVLDAGFYKVDELPAFDSLREEGHLLGTRDFVNQGGNVFTESTHGMMVLSIMAANLPGEIVGTAPRAGYWLLRSEDAATEYPVEEDFWVAAAEFADSAGADIISSSLGYTVFYDDSLNHTYEDMDGNTTHVTRGADLAASKGMLVLNSAGNSGGSSWQYISAPADGDSVIAVGAVDAYGHYTSFSSTGPTYDKRIKPNVAAQGLGTMVYSSSGGVFPGSGTSFACPVISGAAACLWQAHPGASNMDILEAIQKSSDQYANPDSLKGFGIPDMQQADLSLYKPAENHPPGQFYFFPNPSGDILSIQVALADYQDITFEILDETGRVVLPEMICHAHPGENALQIVDTQVLSEGLYLIHFSAASGKGLFKWLKM
ncbi:MAG: S8 family serine peptidase [Bacteroidetes bacterium]|nr:S8 family serine peptidase [Bacteroidota bacterium]